VKRAAVIVVVTWVIASWCGSANCMTFRIVWNPEEKINVIIGEGPIAQGDKERLEKVISLSGRDRYGNIPLYLNSPGGSVEAAFKLVELMDIEEFSALVSSGGRCASACASIVYLSARFHQVVGSGLLGIHTCYSVDQKTGAPEPSSFCNEVIAQNAVNHGTSYGALQMWQRHYAPEQVAWIGREGACKCVDLLEALDEIDDEVFQVCHVDRVSVVGLLATLLDVPLRYFATSQPKKKVAHRPRGSIQNPILRMLILDLYRSVVEQGRGKLTLRRDVDDIKGTLPAVLAILRPFLPKVIPVKIPYKTLRNARKSAGQARSQALRIRD
jgi:membrane-bound ClpP family serine protease